MKKKNLFYAAGLMMVCAFGVQSCAVEDNPAGGMQPTKSVLTYDFAAAAVAGENPDNFNGNQNNGQGFYGWEKEDKTDSRRNDYKGYVWGSTSVLPEVCHVFRRSDRINGNIKEGGLFCPNDREMAIDGLQPGSKVQIFYIAPLVSSKISLQEVPFQTWDGWVNANPTGNGYGAWVVGESTGQPYGDPSVNNYADLSAYTKLTVVATEGTPRMLFNRDIAEGQCSDIEAESHLIDNTNAGCMKWASKYFKSETKEDGSTVWTVDLALMVKEKGFAHLHAIKGGNWQNVTVTSMTLETAPVEQKAIWAIGDGSSESIDVRATATIDGIEAVTGQTEIPSGAVIDVKTVTPAVKGTGYIVFKVRKNMVVTKIVIDGAVK
jgi:hypothetical protein